MSKLTVERIVVQGFKSIRAAEVELKPINVLIGVNGSGKSNLLSLFSFMNQVARRRMQKYVAQAGGADRLLHYGRKITERLHVELYFRTDEQSAMYTCSLIPTAEDLLIFEEEIFGSVATTVADRLPHEETALFDWEGRVPFAASLLKAFSTWHLYHFHDTSDSAKVKQMGDIHDNLVLRPDASNLAAYLYMLKNTAPEYYRNIVGIVQLAFPFFGDFVLRPSPLNPERIRLEWRERDSDLLFGPHDLSDGTLRFICLTTLLSQPPERLPAIILLDEPELGLHPHAVVLLAEMVRSAALHTQVILATQSVTLVNQFDPEDILVVERVYGETLFGRTTEEELASWLKDYTLGELWEKNLLAMVAKRSQEGPLEKGSVP